MVVSYLSLPTAVALGVQSDANYVVNSAQSSGKVCAYVCVCVGGWLTRVSGCQGLHTIHTHTHTRRERGGRVGRDSEEMLRRQTRGGASQRDADSSASAFSVVSQGVSI